MSNHNKDRGLSVEKEYVYDCIVIGAGPGVSRLPFIWEGITEKSLLSTGVGAGQHMQNISRIFSYRR
jgi:hypothetical protein